MLQFMINNFDNVVVAITAVISAASAICALTPSQTDDKVVSKIRSFLEVLALNVGNAKKEA